MQVLTFVEPGKVEFRELLAPAIEGRGQAIVRPLAGALLHPPADEHSRTCLRAPSSAAPRCGAMRS